MSSIAWAAGLSIQVLRIGLTECKVKFNEVKVLRGQRASELRSYFLKVKVSLYSFSVPYI